MENNGMIQPTKSTATRDAYKPPDGRTKEHHRYVVWMNYQDLFVNRDEFERACDDYAAGVLRRKGQAEEAKEPTTRVSSGPFGCGTGGGRRVIRSPKGMD